MSSQTRRARRPAARLPLLEVRDLKKQFPIIRGLFSRVSGQVRAVDGVSFRIGAGETLGLVGESGCGKSTVGRTIVEAARAERRLDPRRRRGHHRARRRSTCCPTAGALQMIYQDPYASLNPRMSAGQIVGEPLIIHGVGRPQERRERVAFLFSRVGLRPEAMHAFPHEFSGGQRQRIGIARALALNPELIVGDEPVSALDVSIQAQIINLLMDLQEEYKLSYLLVAHDLAVVQHISHRVAVMYLGRIVEMTDSKRLFEMPLHPYYRGAVVGGADPEGERPQARAGHPQGRRAEPDQSAVWLSFPHPLSLRACALPFRIADAPGGHARTLGVLPSARCRPDVSAGGPQGHGMTAEHPMKLALLDDYHGVALQMADWARLAGRVEIVSFDAPIADAEDLVRRLAPFDAILAMRERTAFPRSILQQLPKLRLLITTGLWNASIDSASGDRARHPGLRHAGRGTSDGRAHLGLDLGAGAANAARGTCAT